METASLNFPRHTRASCSLPIASGLRVKFRIAMTRNEGNYSLELFVMRSLLAYSLLSVESDPLLL